MSAPKSLLSVFLVLSMIVAPLAISEAQAGPRDEARKHYQKGNQLFSAGDYQGAIREFKSADRLAPSPLLGFNIGLCHDRLGQSSEALRYYRGYLKAVPNAQNRSAVEASIRRLEEAERNRPKKDPPKEDLPKVPPVPAEPKLESAPSAPVPDAPAYTGSDKALQRAAAIDIAAIRSRYRGGGEQESAPVGSTDTSPPEGVGEPPPPPPASGIRPTSPPPPTSAAQPTDPVPQKSATPIYKKWWFWVVLGVGALVVINIAVDDGNSSNQTRTNGLLLPQSGPSIPEGGATLWRF